MTGTTQEGLLWRRHGFPGPAAYVYSGRRPARPHRDVTEGASKKVGIRKFRAMGAGAFPEACTEGVRPRRFGQENEAGFMEQQQDRIRSISLVKKQSPGRPYWLIQLVCRFGLGAGQLPKREQGTVRSCADSQMGATRLLGRSSTGPIGRGTPSNECAATRSHPVVPREGMARFADGMSFRWDEIPVTQLAELRSREIEAGSARKAFAF